MGIEAEIGMFEMPGNEYFALPHLSQSFLKQYLRSPFHAKNPRHRESTAALEFGTQFHELLMEPDVFAGRYVEDQVYQHDGRTKEGKAERLAAEQVRQGRTGISPTNWQLLHNMLEASINDSVTRQLFAAGKAEQVLLWQDELGVPCKARIDWLPDAIPGCIVDVKTTTDSNPTYLQTS